MPIYVQNIRQIHDICKFLAIIFFFCLQINVNTWKLEIEKYLFFQKKNQVVKGDFHGRHPTLLNPTNS